MDNIWNKLQQLFGKSKYDITIFENKNENENGNNECDSLNIPYNSVLGSIVMNCSGITVDCWIKILGHGSENRNGVFYYNTIVKDECSEGMFIVALDVVGGIYGINISKFKNEQNTIWYFAPDTLEWESLGMKYADFIAWTLQGNVDVFYKSMRWNEWKKDCQNIEFNYCYLIYPFLWSKECCINSATKREVILDELLNLNFDYVRRLYK